MPPASEKKRPTAKRAAAAAVSGVVLVCVAIRVWDELCDKEGIQLTSGASQKGETSGLTGRATSLSVSGPDGLGILLSLSIQYTSACHPCAVGRGLVRTGCSMNCRHDDEASSCWSLRLWDPSVSVPDGPFVNRQ